MIRPFVHIMLHFFVPALVARWWFPEKWKKAWTIMVVTLVVDLDHLLAVPIFDPHRCSIGFHPLHSYWALLVYMGLCALPKTRIIGLGLVIHMALDWIDCIWMAMA